LVSLFGENIFEIHQVSKRFFTFLTYRVYKEVELFWHLETTDDVVVYQESFDY